MERPEKVLANPKEMWEFMYKNIESKEQAKARAKTVKQSIQNARDAKDAKAYAK